MSTFAVSSFWFPSFFVCDALFRSLPLMVLNELDLFHLTVALISASRIVLFKIRAADGDLEPENVAC